MTAINSHAILSIARECARYQGDLWIVYMGNNEFAGPFGANTVFGPQVPPHLVVRAYLAWQQTRVGQWLIALSHKTGHGKAGPSSWGGLRMFVEHQLAPDNPRRERVYRNFEQNLKGIIQAGRRSGVPIILSSVASNLKDCAPFGSRHATILKTATKAAAGPNQTSLIEDWDKLYKDGVSKLEQQRWLEALPVCQAAERLSPQYAELQFRLGQCYLALTNREAARKSFERARDLDALPFRADSRINTIIHNAAKSPAGKGVIYLDASDALSHESPGDILGEELFYDHVHLNFEGNYRLARAFADQIATRQTASLGNPKTEAWASPAVCAERLGLTDWNRYTVLDEVLRRLSDVPFTSQANHAIRFRRLVGQLVAIQNRLQPPAWSQARQTYEAAIRQNPTDPWLHQNYAEFLKAIGDLSSGTTQMQKVRTLLPHYCITYLQLGRFLARQDKYVEARQSLEQALRLRPDLVEAYLELSQIDASEGKLDEALKQLAAAQRFRPDDVMVCLRRADILAAQQKRPEAILNLRAAIRLRPTNWEVRYRLGVELATDDKTLEAQAEFEEVVRLRPDHVLGHLNLGVMLARQDRFDEARARFQETLRLDPQNEKARQFIEDLKQSANHP